MCSLSSTPPSVEMLVRIAGGDPTFSPPTSLQTFSPHLLSPPLSPTSLLHFAFLTFIWHFFKKLLWKEFNASLYSSQKDCLNPTLKVKEICDKMYEFASKENKVPSIHLANMTSKLYPKSMEQGGQRNHNCDWSCNYNKVRLSSLKLRFFRFMWRGSSSSRCWSWRSEWSSYWCRSRQGRSLSLCPLPAKYGGVTSGCHAPPPHSRSSPTPDPVICPRGQLLSAGRGGNNQHPSFV